MSTQSATLVSSQTIVTQAPSPLWKCIEAAERVAATASLLCFAPAAIFLGAAIAILSRRSPLVAHLRVGQNGVPLWVLKFRTMWDRSGAPNRGFEWIEWIVDEEGPLRKSSADARVTHWVARFCRRHSLDELPQLFLVAAGRMSLVGPRPVTRGELETYYGECAARILRLKPGLTGLWQVMGRNRLSYRRRVRLDRFYSERRSVRLYLGILARTLPVLVRAEDAW